MANLSENLSMTIGDLSLDTGLLDMTCSGLLSSPDSSNVSNVHRDAEHDYSTCSCHGDEKELKEAEVDDVEMSRAGDSKESPHEVQVEAEAENDGKTNSFNADHILSPAPISLSKLPNEAGDAQGPPSESGINMMGPPSENMSLFNDTSFNISKALSRVDRNETIGGYSYSYADSTKFYSLVQNLEDFMGKDEGDEDHDNGHDSSFNSMGEVEINEEQVSFRNHSSLLAKNQRNEFLLSNGDLDVDSVHQNTLAIEENFTTREKLTKKLAEALEACILSNEEKDREIEILRVQIEDQQRVIASKELLEEEKKGESSPSPDTFSSESEPLNSQVEDLKLQVADLGKKLDIEKKYLETQTAERELERDDYQRQISSLVARVNEVIRDKGRLEILVSNQKTEMEDFEMKIKEALDSQEEVRYRCDRIEDERRSAVEKIHELRSIIVDLEKQYDEQTSDVRELKDENKVLKENLERLEKIREQEEQEPPHEDTIVTVNTDLTEELHAQVEDLAQRVQRKLNEMDNFQWSTRPNSSCSNAVSVSNEDISVSRDLGYINKDHEYAPQDLAALIMDGFRKLDGQFESLVRFEEIIMKKLRDSEIRASNAKKLQEDLESEKQILLEKLRSQTMKISDLENCLDQSRFEPNPNAVTLSGLRARVATQKAELEESQGKLHLKELELQDLTDRLSAKDALLTKLSSSPQHTYQPPPVQKFSASAQTEDRKKLQNISVQTEPVEEPVFKVPKPKSMKDVSVQTQQVESLEISSIQGVTPVTHSTPNEGSLGKAAMRNLMKKKSKNNTESDTMFTNQISEQDRTPEILRDPARSRMHVSFLSDKMPRLQDLKQLETDTVQKYDSEQSSEDPQQRFDNLRETGRGGGGGGGGAGNGNEGDSSGMISGSRPASGASGGSGYDGDVSRSGAGTREGSAPAGVGGRSAGGIGGRSADGIGGRSSSADGIEGRSAGGLGGRSAMGTGTGPMSKDSQTPPLALANLIDALDAEEKKRLFEELNKAENLSPIIASKNEEIQNLLDQIKDLESKCGFGGGGNNEGIEGGRGSRSSSSRGRSGQEGIGGRSALGRNSGGGNNASNSNAGALGSNDRTAGSNVEAAGSCIIETTLDFDDTMKPIKTDTRMNYVVNAKKNSGGATARAAEESGYGSRKGSSKLSLNPEVIQEAKCIYDAIGCDLNAMARLTVMQYQTVLQVLTAVVQAEYDSPESDRNSSTSAEGIQEPEQTYTYELETVCDFQVGNNGDLTLVNAQGRVIPSESYARVSSGAHPLGSGSNLAQPEVVVERGVQSAPTGSPGNTSARQVLQGSGLLDMNSGGDEALDFPDPPPSNTVDWGRLEKDKERRLNETDCLVELSTLRTNMELLRQAYEQEKARIKAYEERLADCDDLSRQLCQERGTANELKYVIDQQQQQINSLTQLIQQLQSGRESGASGLTTLGQGVPDSSSPNTSVFPNDGSNGGGGGVLSPSEAELNLASSEASPVRGRNSGLPPSVSQRGSKVDNSGAATSASVVLSNNKRELVNRQTQKWFELYLRAKSYRKALAWQKKYLAIVIQGYKDLLTGSGAAFEHPDLLQRQIPITPSSVGLCDRKKGKTRFRIIGKVVLAAIRMKYMVNRWNGKITIRPATQDVQRRVPFPESTRFASPSSTASSESDSSSGQDFRERRDGPSRTGHFNAFSPPTKDSKDSGKSRAAPHKLIKTLHVSNKEIHSTTSSLQRIPTDEQQPPRSQQPRSSSNSNINNAASSARNVSVRASQISQYLERFQNLENEIGSTISRAGTSTTALPRERRGSEK